MEKPSFKVMSRCCEECLFTSNRLIMEQEADRLIQRCLDDDRFFECHRSTYAEGDADVDTVCCKGFFDQHAKDVLPIRMAYLYQAQGVGEVEMVNPDDYPKSPFVQSLCEARDEVDALL